MIAAMKAERGAARTAAAKAEGQTEVLRDGLGRVVCPWGPSRSHPKGDVRGAVPTLSAYGANRNRPGAERRAALV